MRPPGAGVRVASGLGHPRVHLRRTDSTNLRARALAAAGAPHGTVVTASEQCAGRGRQGRTWTAPAGTAILMSLIVRDPPPLLSLVAGVAVAETAEAVGASRVALKWPNDVWIDSRKVAGVLVEARPEDGWAVLGIGLNVVTPPGGYPAGLAGRAASLGLAPPDLEPVLARLLAALSAWIGSDPNHDPNPDPGAHPATIPGTAAVLEAVRARDALRDRTVAWSTGSGVGAGIGAGGELLVDTAAGRVALNAGEVHLRTDVNVNR